MEAPGRRNGRCRCYTPAPEEFKKVPKAPRGLGSCPPRGRALDSMQSVLATKESPVGISIDFELCESSGVCEQVCPEDVFEHEDGRTKLVKPNQCTDCWLCVEQCVAGAITLE
jgi:NAD-dependent dihydropyrimidine dehydrogenase PreA subunit